MRNVEIDSATAEEEEHIRDDYDTLVRCIGAGQAQTKLHIPQEDGKAKPLCGESLDKSDREWQNVSKKTYPLGYKDFCLRCVKDWRDRENDEIDCAECDRGAVGVVKTPEENLFLCGYHYKTAKEEYGPIVEESRLLEVYDE